ncbi:cation-transporting ATPase [Sphaerisporangium sp. NPDC005288]|uniref:cation-transporting ATPase n=1 Tax=Sphaerisporangium sp. NPDC005288 TaxID=3155114 RepID=UPI0033B90427
MTVVAEGKLEEKPMSVVICTVKGMTCGTRVNFVKEEAAAVPGRTNVEIGLAGGSLIVEGGGFVEKTPVMAAFHEAGYAVAGRP